MTRRLIATAVPFALLLLTACSSPALDNLQSPDSEIVDIVTTDEGAGDSDNDRIARITSCGQVEGAVAPFIANLVPDDDNVVNEWGVSCKWEMDENDTNWQNNRSVAVGITPSANEKPDVEALSEFTEEITGFDDAWVADQGGVAYSMAGATAVTGVIVTTVWLPYAEVMITGGTWGDMPALDAAAAVQIAQELLG